MPKNVFKTYNKFRAALLGAAFLFSACEIQESKPLGEINKNFADRTIVQAFLTYKDSGIVRMELQAPLVEEFTLIDSPYTVMRKGVDIKFWNKEPEPNYLRADWAKILDRKKFYEGRGNVEMINTDGDTLRTQQIFWDNQKRLIYTTDTVIIKRKNGTFNIANHGLTATEDFREFKLLDNSGIITLEEKSDRKTKSTTRQPSIPESERTEINPLLHSDSNP
ncbi:MAG: LPS export ABC transporter periplasmic protein LptC [Flavobacteriaceae bacterium]|nr:LPS export ABC transporter periplasmic protein LptC [Flavobacteriaceae bacterium]